MTIVIQAASEGVKRDGDETGSDERAPEGTVGKEQNPQNLRQKNEQWKQLHARSCCRMLPPFHLGFSRSC